MIRAILYVTDDSNQSGRAKLMEIEGDSLVETLRDTADAIDKSKVESDMAQITVKVEEETPTKDVDLAAAVKAHKNKSKK